MKIPAIANNVLLSVVFAFVLTACDNNTSEYYDVTEPLPPRTIVGGRGIPGPDILNQLLKPIPQDLKGNEKFNSEEFDYPDSVQLDALTLNISGLSNESQEFIQQDAIQDNFDFLSSLKVYILANFSGTNQRLLVASAVEPDFQPDGDIQTLNFTMTGADILPFVEASDGFKVQYVASGEVPADDVTFAGQVRYRVSVAGN